MQRVPPRKNNGTTNQNGRTATDETEWIIMKINDYQEKGNIPTSKSENVYLIAMLSESMYTKHQHTTFRPPNLGTSSR